MHVYQDFRTCISIDLFITLGGVRTNLLVHELTYEEKDRQSPIKTAEVSIRRNLKTPFSLAAVSGHRFEPKKNSFFLGPKHNGPTQRKGRRVVFFREQT